jgi:hypothetical protein
MALTLLVKVSINPKHGGYTYVHFIHTCSAACAFRVRGHKPKCRAPASMPTAANHPFSNSPKALPQNEASEMDKGVIRL